MKTLIVVTALSLVINFAHAQKIKPTDVPGNLKVALQQQYNAPNAKWDKEGENYEASFLQKGKEMSVVFSATGFVLEVETEIHKEEFPKAALEILKNEYSDFKLEETARIEANGTVTYETEVEKGELSFDLIFDDQGKLIQKIEKKED